VRFKIGTLTVPWLPSTNLRYEAIKHNSKIFFIAWVVGVSTLISIPYISPNLTQLSGFMGVSCLSACIYLSQILEAKDIFAVTQLRSKQSVNSPSQKCERIANKIANIRRIKRKCYFGRKIEVKDICCLRFIYRFRVHFIYFHFFFCTHILFINVSLRRCTSKFFWIEYDSESIHI